MRIVENLPPPQPPRTFDLMEVSEEELRHILAALGDYPSLEYGWPLHRQIKTALAD